MSLWFLCQTLMSRLQSGHFAASSGQETALVAVDLEEDQASELAYYLYPKHARNTHADMPTQVKGETKLVSKQWGTVWIFRSMKPMGSKCY